MGTTGIAGTALSSGFLTLLLILVKTIAVFISLPIFLLLALALFLRIHHIGYWMAVMGLLVIQGLLIAFTFSLSIPACLSITIGVFVLIYLWMASIPWHCKTNRTNKARLFSLNIDTQEKGKRVRFSLSIPFILIHVLARLTHRRIERELTKNGIPISTHELITLLRDEGSGFSIDVDSPDAKVHIRLN